MPVMPRPKGKAQKIAMKVMKSHSNESKEKLSDDKKVQRQMDREIIR